VTSGSRYPGEAEPGGRQDNPTGEAAEEALEMGRQQIRGSAVLLVGRILSLLLTTATQILIVRILTKADFGAFAYALVLGSAARTLLSLGQGRLLSRFMSIYDEQRDYDRMFGAMFLAAGTIAVTSTVTLLALFLFRDPLIGSVVADPGDVQVVLILAFLAPLEAFDQVFVSLFAVFSRARAIFFRKYLFVPGLRLVVVLLLALIGADVVFLAIGYVVTQAIGMVVYVAMLGRMLRERNLLQHLRLRQLALPYRAVFAFSFPLITNELVFLSMNTGGVLLLGYFHSIEEIANYRAVYPAARLNHVIWMVFVTLFLPMAARMFARDDIEGLRRSYWHTAILVAVFTFPIFALTGPLAPDVIVLLFGERYAESAVVLALLSTGYFVNVMLGFNAYILQVCGRIRFLVGVNVLVILLNIGLGFLLVPQLAAGGVAVANCTTLVVQNLLNQHALRRSLGTAFIERRYVRSYLVIATAAAVLWTFQLALDPGLVVSLIAATMVSIAVLLANWGALELAETFPELRRMSALHDWFRNRRG
jgi:O-antigen/teichoic acid export membrane protein